jgi:hypothetical protein
VTKTLLAVVVACAALTVGCGSSKEPPGHALAAEACKSSGTTAANDATQAASLNPVYGTLATDERAAAAQEAATGADTGLGSGAAATILTGQGAGFTVIKDCVSLGLPVTH